MLFLQFFLSHLKVHFYDYLIVKPTSPEICVCVCVWRCRVYFIHLFITHLLIQYYSLVIADFFVI